MRLLFDQNLSRFLVDELSEVFPDGVHVTAAGLATASDRELWDFAAQRGYVIVSKDSDFRQLAFLLGPPPKAVWMRVGNVSTAAILALLRDSVEVIERFSDSADEALLVLPHLGDGT